MLQSKSKSRTDQKKYENMLQSKSKSRTARKSMRICCNLNSNLELLEKCENMLQSNLSRTDQKKYENLELARKRSIKTKCKQMYNSIYDQGCILYILTPEFISKVIK